MHHRACLLFLFVLLTVFLPLSAEEIAEGSRAPKETSSPQSDGEISSNPNGSLDTVVASEGEDAFPEPEQTPPGDTSQSPYPPSNGDGLFEGMASSDGSFSISYKPDFTIGNLSLQLDLKIQGKVAFDPFVLDLDFSPWEIPKREAGEAFDEYMLRVARHYGAFIRSVQWGQRYEPLYIRYGKLMGITLGDGALLNSYSDYSVGYRESRPGLDIMLEGNLLNIPNAGFEFVTNDLYEPTLRAWRIYALPLVEYPNLEHLSQLEIGLSYADSPQRGDTEGEGTFGRELIALDFSLPLYERDLFTLDVFSNLLLQLPDAHNKQFGSAFRYGFWGHSKSFFVFNTSFTIPTFGSYYTNYYASDFEQRSEAETDALLLELGTLHLDGMLGLNFTRQGLYLSTYLESRYTKGDFHDYHFTVNARIDKTFMHIVSLDLQYEKLYPTDTGEGFFKGLQTLNNVVLSTTTVIKVKPYSFDIGLNVHFDEVAKPTYSLDTLVRISIL
ncbi:MAG: hypothetical protein ACQ5SW_00700 [Sphaerochaetaceae bacterium]